MTYRSLLVLLEGDRRGPARVDFAVQLANRLDAHLCGVAPVRWLDLAWPPMAATPNTMFEAAAQAWREVADTKARLAQAFREACESAGLRSFEAVVDQQDVEAAVVKRSRLHDLTLLSQSDPAEIDDKLQQAMVEQVVLHGGRPVLLLPYAGTFEAGLHHVLIAWNGTREAARAVADALPLLAAAERVSLHCWEESSARADLDVQLEQVRCWLARHAVNATVHAEGGGAPVEDELLSRAADVGADLIVMGAYGHNRWRERVLGGATRGILRSMTVPVLMSH